MTLDIIVKQKDSNGDIILDEQGNPIIIEENHLYDKEADVFYPQSNGTYILNPNKEAIK